MTYRWTLNLVKDGSVKSVSVVANDLVEVISKINSRYPGWTVTFAARMEAITV
jgi:hypothetical protein